MKPLNLFYNAWLIRVWLCCCLLLLLLWHPAAEARKASRKQLLSAVELASSFKNRFEAEVWLRDMSQRLAKKVPDPVQRLKILRLAHKHAIKHKLSPEVVLSVMEVESNFNRFAVSRVGARGLMQIMPFWIKELGPPEANLFDVNTNIHYGCTILRRYLNRERGNLTRALGRYNGSLGKRKYPAKVFRARRLRWYRQ